MADPRIWYVNERGCRVWVYPDYLTAEQATALHTECKELPLVHHYLGIKYGKPTWQPRMSMALEHTYSYSGTVHPCIPWTKAPLSKYHCDRINRDFKILGSQI
jgi:hypothetical protein